MEWHAIKKEDVLRRLETGKKGLSSEEARKRLEKYGPNKMEIEEKASILRIFAEQFHSPLIILLIAAALVSYVIGFIPGQESRALDSLLIISIVIANGFFGFIQDYRAEKTIEELKRMSALRCTVIRNGEKISIDSERLVPGDIVFLQEGNIVPADCRIIQSNDLKIDESLLTGESEAVSKKNSVLVKETPLAERQNMAWMNTSVVRGSGIAVVTETGLSTEVGKIAKNIKEAKKPLTPFQREVSALGKKVGAGVVGIIIIIALVELMAGAGDFLTIFLTATSLAVAAVPEGLPAVVTLALSIGTRKMAKKNALVRKLPVVESLGSVDVICTDKTGTLTENRMTVRKIYFNGKVAGMQNKKELKDAMLLFEAGMVCNNASADGTGDPTEVALLKSALVAGANASKYKRIGEIAFSSQRKRMTVVCSSEGRYIAIMKGAPEVVLERCSHLCINGKEIRLDANMRSKILEINKKFAASSLRVIGFAMKRVKSPKIGEGIENGMVFLGLQAMQDPPRKGVRESISQCKRAGIRIVMITGDNLDTAKAIASEIGMGTKAVYGPDLDRMDEIEISKMVEQIDIFARVTPEHKVRILKALQSNGHRVAITGDGVNDAPALKSSDIGISMGLRGSDVAKSASDMILLDDNFSTIVSAIREGRAIFQNIRKFVAYLLTCNLAEVMVVFFASLAGYMALTPIHLLWINLLTDGAPAIALAADPAGRDIMKRKPRRSDEGIINREMILLITSIGFLMAFLILLVFKEGLRFGLSTAQTMVLTSFVIYEFVRIVSIRQQERISFFSNKYLILAISFSMLMQLIVLYTPLNAVFGLVPLGIIEWAIILLGAMIGWAGGLIVPKLILRK